MTKPRRTLIAAVVLVAMLFAMTLPAAAITGGEPDGNRHPNVGLILFYDATGRFRCSATLVSPTVLITAAHCTDGTLGSTVVTFDSVIALQPPSPFPAAADPSVGYTPEEITAAGYLSGTAYTHPDVLRVHRSCQLERCRCDRARRAGDRHHAGDHGTDELP